MLLCRLLEEWHESNPPPETVSRGTNNKKYRWRCKDCGHEHLSPPGRKFVQNKGCPQCHKGSRNRRPLLQDGYPAVAAEYVEAANEKSLEDLRSASNLRVTWRCAVCGNIWQARVADRTFSGSGCPSPECLKRTRELRARLK